MLAIVLLVGDGPHKVGPFMSLGMQLFGYRAQYFKTTLHYLEVLYMLQVSFLLLYLVIAYLRVIYALKDMVAIFMLLIQAQA